MAEAVPERRLRACRHGHATHRGSAPARIEDLRARAVLWHVGGGTLGVLAGTKRAAPKWASRLGMEWLHRFTFEPQTRGRYLFGIPRFIAAVGWLWIVGRKSKNPA